MKVWYFIRSNGHTAGSINEIKIRAMACHRRVYWCDISDFKGHFLGDEWNG